MPESRDQFFERLRREIAGSYLAAPGNPYRQSGRRTAGAERWEQSRRCIVDAVDRDGDFMDIGCANGLLLESLIEWAGERGVAIRPHGVDFVPELVELARERFPGHGDCFGVANAFYWQPGRQYDYVRTNVEYFLPDDRGYVARRLYDLAVVPGGRLIVCHYPDRGEAAVDPGIELETLGFRLAGRSGCARILLAWVDKLTG